MPTARRTRTRAPTPKNSPASMRTGSSKAASGTTCRRKPRRSLPRLSSISPEDNGNSRHSPSRFPGVREEVNGHFVYPSLLASTKAQNGLYMQGRDGYAGSHCRRGAGRTYARHRPWQARRALHADREKRSTARLSEDGALQSAYHGDFPASWDCRAGPRRRLPRRLANGRLSHLRPDAPTGLEDELSHRRPGENEPAPNQRGLDAARAVSDHLAIHPRTAAEIDCAAHC